MFVLSPFSDNIRLVCNESSNPMFKDVVPEDEITRITQSMNSGEGAAMHLSLPTSKRKVFKRWNIP